MELRTAISANFVKTFDQALILFKSNANTEYIENLDRDDVMAWTI